MGFLSDTDEIWFILVEIISLMQGKVEEGHVWHPEATDFLFRRTLKASFEYSLTDPLTLNGKITPDIWSTN